MGSGTSKKGNLVITSCCGNKGEDRTTSPTSIQQLKQPVAQHQNPPKEGRNSSTENTQNIINVKPIPQEHKMGSESFYIDINFNYGKLSYTTFWRAWEKDAGLRDAMQQGVVTNLLKVSGENKLIMIAKISGDLLDDLLYSKIQVIAYYADLMKVSVTPTYDYESFANIVNTITQVEETFEQLPSLDQNTGLFHILDIKMEFRGMTQEDFLTIWKEEIKAALGAKEKGIALDILKSVAERRVFVLTRVDSLALLDTIILTLPMMRKMGDQMYITSKRVSKFNTFIKQIN
ncbi:uncharacterized protein [Clytia hemisphaerica]|uniref:Uncharacterized protein n=2 Tax=Clytia hemisphaerica TaxID=252671 RepID=A0A7M5XCW7_9CNID